MFPTFFIPSAAGYEVTDPVFYAKLDELAAPFIDSSSDAATISNSGAGLTFGVSAPAALGGRAVRFVPGSFSSINWPKPVRWVGDDFTLEAWVRTTDTDMQSGIGGFYQTCGIINGDIGGIQADYGMSMSSSIAQVNFGVGAAGYAVNQVGEVAHGTISSGSINDGVWHHLVGTRVKSTGVLRLYVDGVQVNTKTADTDTKPGSSTVRIGYEVDQPDFDICHVAMYARALSAAEVLAHYRAVFP